MAQGVYRGCLRDETCFFLPGTLLLPKGFAGLDRIVKQCDNLASKTNSQKLMRTKRLITTICGVWDWPLSSQCSHNLHIDHIVTTPAAPHGPVVKPLLPLLFIVRTECWQACESHTHTPFIYPKLSDIKVDIQKLSSKQLIRAICFGRHHPRCGRGSTEDNEDLRQISPTALYTIFSTRLGACVSVHWWVGYQPTQLS